MKTERFELKLSKEDKSLLKSAAKVEAKSLGRFMADASAAHARLVVCQNVAPKPVDVPNR